MQTTSATWTQLWESGTAWLECKAIINDVEYTGIVPAINRALTQGGLSIGNAVAATCQFTIHTDNVIPKSAKVEIKKRLTDGTTSSEWLNAGTFFISRRSKDVVIGKMNFECYDAMLKANAVFPDNTDVGYYPRSMVNMAQDIAEMLDVTLDSRNVIKTGDNYVINEPDAGTTISDILNIISGANGGNWCITPDNKLRLVPIISADGSEQAVNNVIDVLGVVQNMGVGDECTVTGVRYEYDNMPVVLGDETGIVLEANNAAFANDLYDELIGLVYRPFTLSGAIYNPVAELGDYVRGGANGEINSVLFVENAVLGFAFRGEISAPDTDEMNDEYPYIGASSKTLIASKIYTVQQVNTLNESLDQVGVFNRLTNNGDVQGIYLYDGKVYINADYIGANGLNVSDIKAGLIHSADYSFVNIPKLYPNTNIFPTHELYPNNGEYVTSGFAIDFETGQIYGGFYSEQIAELQSSVEALRNALVYPKSVP